MDHRYLVFTLCYYLSNFLLLRKRLLINLLILDIFIFLIVFLIFDEIHYVESFGINLLIFYQMSVIEIVLIRVRINVL